MLSSSFKKLIFLISIVMLFASGIFAYRYHLQNIELPEEPEEQVDFGAYIDEAIKGLPEVLLIEKKINVAPDTTGKTRALFEIFVVKKDEQNFSYTEYTDKLIKSRIISSVKERVAKDNPEVELYFHVVILSRY